MSYGSRGKYVTMWSRYFANFARSWLEVRSKLRRSLHQVGSKYVRSWTEVCTKLSRTYVRISYEVAPNFEVVPNFVRSGPELRTKWSRTLYEVAPNFVRSGPELRIKFSSDVRFEMETYFPRLPYVHNLYCFFVCLIYGFLAGNCVLPSPLCIVSKEKKCDKNAKLYPCTFKVIGISPLIGEALPSMILAK